MADRFTDAQWDQLGELLTSAERQLVEMLRQRDRRRDFDFQICIGMQDGAWEVSLSELGTDRGARGVGTTFDEAWVRSTSLDP